MTVKELIAQLKLLDPAAKVHLSRDSEGNGIYVVDELTSGTRIILWPGREVGL